MAEPSTEPPSLAPLTFSDEQPDVWARSTPSPSPSSATGASPAEVLSAVARPLPDLADLDPYAPSSSAWSDQQSANWTTLGATVQSSSKLEILPPEEDSPPASATAPSAGQGFVQLPTSFQVEGQGGPAAPPAPSPRPPPKPAPSNLSATAAPSSSGGPAAFLGGVFRSMSGSGSPSPSSPTASSHPQQGPATPLKSAPAPPRHSDPPQPQGEHAEPPSSLPKPLASIASVFRAPLGSRTSSSAGTPPSGSSPINTRGSEKMAEAAAARRLSASNAPGGKENGGAKQKQEEEKDREEAQFDFNKFLEQMRSRSADPIAKYLRSFLKEFSRRPPVSTADQIRVINDFLDFIAVKMRSVDPWRGYFAPGGVGDKEGWSAERREAEFEVAGEAMEKLVMNRVWHLTFTPALDLSTLSSFPGQTSSTGDIERDAILAQRIKLFAWIKPSHLDLPIPDPVDGEEDGDDSRPATPKVGDLLGGGSEGSEKAAGGEIEVAETEQQKQKQRRQVQSFLDFARRELGKMNQYKAPRDKLICVLNCCKVIFGLIRSLSTKEEGADTFIPFLIYVVLKANPEHLVSNLQYIQRFRNPEKLSGEGGYYLSSLNGAISFIETVDASSLSNITQEEFETNVANAIRNLPQPDDSPRLSKAPQFPSPSSQPPSPNPNAHSQRRSPDLSRTSGAAQRQQQRPHPHLQTSVDAPLATPDGTELESPSLLSQPGLSFPSSAKGFLLRSTDSVERAMSKPLGAIGRIFDQLDQRVQDVGVGGRPSQMESSPLQQGVAPPGQGRRNTRRFSGDPNAPPPPPPPQQFGGPQPHLQGMYAQEGSSVQEVSRQIEQQHEQQRLASINTLKSVFPGIEDEVLEMVLLSNSGDMAKTIDALLEMS